MKLDISGFSNENVEEFVKKVEESEEKIEIEVNDVLPTSIFQVVVCNKDKFSVKVNNPLMKKVFDWFEFSNENSADSE
jgi:hypothetical protein